MQTRNRFFDDLAKVATSAVGTVAGMKDEIEQMIRHRVEKFVEGMSLVSREEFDVVQAMVAKSREEQEKLGVRIVELETRLKAQPLKKIPEVAIPKKPKAIKNLKKT
jgi:BMFP domain-containing protein YqiC